MASELINEIKTRFKCNNIEIIDNIICVTKLNWEYLDALKFQEWCTDLVYSNHKLIILIFTSHSTCLTLGRGLQRNSDEDGHLHYQNVH